VCGRDGPDEGVGRPCAILPLRSGHSGSDSTISTLQRTTHGPLLRDLRQGIDGRFQPPVIGDEPRSSPPSHETEPPAPRHRAEGSADEGARLHPLPTHAVEVGEVARHRRPRRFISKTRSRTGRPGGRSFMCPAARPSARPARRTCQIPTGRVIGTIRSPDWPIGGRRRSVLSVDSARLAPGLTTNLDYQSPGGYLSAEDAHRSAESSQIVKGPSLTRLTAISAPNRPVATVTPRPRRASANRR
jgi:hypothetical protein